MSVVGIDAATGVLLVDGRRVFPLVLSNGPPPGRKAPSGRNGLAEVAAAGVNFVRTGSASWDVQAIAAQRALLDAAAQHGLLGWLWLGELPNLPQGPSPRARQLAQVVDGLQSHPALGAYKGVDEPRNVFRGKDWIRPDPWTRVLYPDKDCDFSKVPKGSKSGTITVKRS